MNLKDKRNKRGRKIILYWQNLKVHSKAMKNAQENTREGNN